MSETSTVVYYKTNDAGRQVKVTRTVESKLTPISDELGCESWPRYGDAVGDKVKPVKGENINLVLFPKSMRTKKEAEQPAKPAQTTRYVCKTCKGDHLTFQCPHKDSIATTEPSTPSAVPGVPGVPGVGGDKYVPPALRAASGAGGAKYVPPALRAAMSGVNGMGVPGMALPGMSPAQNRDVGSTLRVSNLPETITEGALRHNFGSVGRVTRCHVPTSKMNGRPRGFAFIEFDTPTQAENARQRFDGVAVDNMIMHVEFAQPRE